MAEIMRVKDEITLAIEARDAGQRKAQLDLGLVPLWSVLPPGIVEVKAAAGGRSAKIVAVASGDCIVQVDVPGMQMGVYSISVLPEAATHLVVVKQ
jgi:hypothetical protein